MEDELRCPSCKELFSEPVLLPCWHALCLSCAVGLQAPPDSQPECCAPDPAGNGPDQEADKLSILSETDSGVVCSSTSTSSRPGSYVGTPGNGGFPPSGGTLCLACPVCQKMVYFDEGGAHNLPKYRAMQHIVDKYQEARNVRLQCQMCEADPREATVACEQCEVLYCDSCRESCHPNRGPLAAHNLGPPRGSWQSSSTRQRGPGDPGATGCADHPTEMVCLYCAMCKSAACSLCLRDRHAAHPHDVLPLAAACKAQKVCVISQDDKAKIPLGITAAKTQAPILMHLDYKVQLSDHDFTVGSRHKLTPSVYAGIVIKENCMGVKEAVTYSGPTYIAIRSGKHSSSTASTHAKDLEKLFELEDFESLVKQEDGQSKPVLMTSVDGGPDENPRYKKVIAHAIDTLKKHDLDALFIFTNAPGRSAFNRVERRMAPLSKALSGVVLLHDTYGNHLDGNGKTIDLDLEKKNFQYAGESLAKIWSELKIDGFNVVAEFISSEEETFPKPDLTKDSWYSNHVRESQYLLQTELSQNLQQLSERARSTTEFIQRLKGMTDKVHEECAALEREVDDRVASLVGQLQARKGRLVEAAQQTRENRVRSLREHVARCASHLQATTALLTFCIEALKETDSAAFLQVGGMLSVRASTAAGSWGAAEGVQEAARLPLLDLTLDDKPLRRAIDQLTFVQLKPPGAPQLIPEECSAENNSVTVAWQPPGGGSGGQRGPAVEGYLLELDDGCGGEFREVYCGRETICTVDGLHFNSLYNARVRAFNSAGEGEYSELIGLQTAEVAWFSWAVGPSSSVLGASMGSGMSMGMGMGMGAGVPQEVTVSEDATSASCEGYEHRVVLSSVGFSRGVHYWELTIDRYHSDTDPAFGVARADVARDQMLGKDDKGWSMYIDRQRSWFMHAGGHAQRTEGGVQQGSTVGVLLDLETTHTLRFFVNDQPQGGVAFRDLYGVFYPAVSLNRGVCVTLHTALDVPRHLLATHDEYLNDVVQS